MSAVVPPRSIETIADLLERLGGVPPRRIRFRPYPGTATEADVLAAMEGLDKCLCELVEGVLVEKAMGYGESALGAFLIMALNAFVQPRNLGIVTGSDGTFRLMAGLVRIPDVAFTSWDHIPGRRRPKKAIPALVPDLAVEILSPRNTRGEMARKRRDYFTAGVRQVWEIDPKRRRAAVYAGVDTFKVLSAADTLDGGDVLPGFRLPLADLFAELDRQG